MYSNAESTTVTYGDPFSWINCIQCKSLLVLWGICTQGMLNELVNPAARSMLCNRRTITNEVWLGKIYYHSGWKVLQSELIRKSILVAFNSSILWIIVFWQFFLWDGSTDGRGANQHGWIYSTTIIYHMYIGWGGGYTFAHHVVPVLGDP